MKPPASSEARLIAAVRDRAFEALERDRGELQPLAAWIDGDGRIGLVSVYAGRDYPEPDLHLVEVRSALKVHVRREARIVGAASAHRERIRVPGIDDPFESVCVQYEARGGRPLRVYYPYRIKKKLSGRSELTRLEPVSVPGSDPVFP
jgi:hypothetical protein